VILPSDPLPEGQLGQGERWTNAARRENRPITRVGVFSFASCLSCLT